jgi:hypothetical protein
MSSGTHGAVVGGALNNVVPGILYAFDAEDVSNVLWSSEGNSSRDGSFMFAKFNPPVVANGRVYMATFGSVPSQPGKQTVSGSVNIYGMRQWSKFLGYGVAPPVTVSAGTRFAVQVNYFNPGITTWKKGSVHFMTTLDPQTWGASSFDLPNDVAPGQSVTMTLELTAPTKITPTENCAVKDATTVTCAFGWALVDPVSGPFGEPASAHIFVTGAVPPPPKCQLCPPGTKFCGCNANGKPTCISPKAVCP